MFIENFSKDCPDCACDNLTIFYDNKPLETRCGKSDDYWQIGGKTESGVQDKVYFELS